MGLTEHAGVQVLGYEGAWGSLFMAVLGLPLAWLMPGNDIGAIPLLRHPRSFRRSAKWTTSGLTYNTFLGDHRSPCAARSGRFAATAPAFAS